MLFRGRDPYSQQVSSRKWGEASDISPVSGREWEPISPIAIKGGYPRKCSWRGMLGWDLLIELAGTRWCPRPPCAAWGSSDSEHPTAIRPRTMAAATRCQVRTPPRAAILGSIIAPHGLNPCLTTRSRSTSSPVKCRTDLRLSFTDARGPAGPIASEGKSGAAALASGPIYEAGP
jgi:hypothetical protein